MTVSSCSGSSCSGTLKRRRRRPLLIDAHIIHQERASGRDSFLYQIRFPTLPSAVMWATSFQLTGQVSLIVATPDIDRAGIPFASAVTVEYLRDD